MIEFLPGQTIVDLTGAMKYICPKSLDTELFTVPWIYDEFVEAIDGTLVTSHVAAPKNIPGLPWTLLTASSSIYSNQVQTNLGSSSNNIIDTKFSQHSIKFDLTWGSYTTSSRFDILLSLLDSTHFWRLFYATTTGLMRIGFVNIGNTNLVSKAITLIPGQTYQVRGYADATKIYFSIGNDVLTYTDGGAYRPGTKAGFQFFPSGTKILPIIVDNFQVDIQPSTLVEDDFTGVDGTLLPAHTISPTNILSSVWTETIANSWAILGNKASSNKTGFAVSVVDAKVSDCTITETVQISATAQVGISFRVSDISNRWACFISYADQNFYLQDRIAGVNTTRAIIPVTINIGQNYTIKVVLSGNTITCTLDGGNTITYSSSFLATSTLHGLFANTSGSINRATCDEFTISVP